MKMNLGRIKDFIRQVYIIYCIQEELTFEFTHDIGSSAVGGLSVTEMYKMYVQKVSGIQVTRYF